MTHHFRMPFDGAGAFIVLNKKTATKRKVFRTYTVSLAQTLNYIDMLRQFLFLKCYVTFFA